MTPTIGRVVIFTQAEGEQPFNCARVHPAIVTRVANEHVVNLCVFLDGNPTAPYTSVPHASVAPPGSQSWDWPPRQG